MRKQSVDLEVDPVEEHWAMMMEWLLQKKGAYPHHYYLNRLILEAINTGKPQALGTYHDLDELR